MSEVSFGPCYLKINDLFLGINGIYIITVPEKSAVLWTFRSDGSISSSSYFWDIWDERHPTVYLYKETPHHPNQKWIWKNTNETFTPNQPFYIFHAHVHVAVTLINNRLVAAPDSHATSFSAVFPISPNIIQPIPPISPLITIPNIKSSIFSVVSFNLAGGVLSDYIVPGMSEAGLVKRCQDKYGKKKGLLSQCTINAIHAVATGFGTNHVPDIIGFQEVFASSSIVFALFELIHSVAKTVNSTSSMKFLQDRGTVIGWNEKTMGPGIQISSVNFDFFGRDMIAVYFAEKGLLAINIHAPHKIDLKTSIEQAGQRLKMKILPKRVMVMEDFNDYTGSLKSLNMFGKKLMIPGNPNTVPKTCCFDSNYQFVGDYIFDSDYYRDDVSFGIPTGYVRFDPLMSDHDPVMLIQQ